jgi:hypothetical protein
VALLHIAAHPSNSSVVIAKGVYETHADPTVAADEAMFVVTTDGGASWSEIESNDNDNDHEEQYQDSFEHLNIMFTDTGRLVCVSIIEARGVGNPVPSTLWVRYADAPYTSFDKATSASLWDSATDWEGGPTTGALTGTSSALFFLGNTSAGGQGDDSHVFMSLDNAATWSELAQPSPGLTGLCYDDIGDVLYGLVHAIDSTSSVLLRMEDPTSGSGAWEDVTAGIPITLSSSIFPYTQQAIWLA